MADRVGMSWLGQLSAADTVGFSVIQFFPWGPWFGGPRPLNKF